MNDMFPYLASEQRLTSVFNVVIVSEHKHEELRIHREASLVFITLQLLMKSCHEKH